MRAFSRVIVAALLAVACTKAVQIKTATDQGTTLSVAVPPQGNEPYKVRIYLPKESNPGADARTKMWFAADSSFFITDKGGGRTYPTIIEPVAGGLANAFEYLVYFDGAQANPETAEFVFNGRHLGSGFIKVPLK
jgi:hypothetical protein